jgi:hypothetical protein
MTVVTADLAPETENEVFSDAGSVIRLDGAVNETVSFQLVLSAAAAAVVDLVTVDDLRQQDRLIPGDQIRLYRQGQVRVSDYPSWYLRLPPHLRAARDFPAVLIPWSAPRGALPIQVEPGRPARGAADPGGAGALCRHLGGTARPAGD